MKVYVLTYRGPGPDGGYYFVYRGVFASLDQAKQFSAGIPTTKEQYEVGWVRTDGNNWACYDGDEPFEFIWEQEIHPEDHSNEQFRAFWEGVWKCEELGEKQMHDQCPNCIPNSPTEGLKTLLSSDSELEKLKQSTGQTDTQGKEDL